MLLPGGEQPTAPTSSSSSETAAAAAAGKGSEGADPPGSRGGRLRHQRRGWGSVPRTVVPGSPGTPDFRLGWGPPGELPRR